MNGRRKSVITLLLLAAVFVVFCNGCSHPTRETNDSIDSVSVNELLTKLEPGLVILGKKAQDSNLKIDYVKITLNTTVTDLNSGGISLLVFKAGGTNKDVSSSEFTVKLTEISTDKSADTSADLDVFINTLEDLLVNADHSIAGLGTSEIVGTLKFVVERRIEGGVEIEDIKIVPVGVSASKSIANAYTQSITVAFKIKSQQSGDDAL